MSIFSDRYNFFKQAFHWNVAVIEKMQLSKTTTFLKTSISTIKAVQKAPLRLLFLALSKVFCLQFVMISIFA